MHCIHVCMCVLGADGDRRVSEHLCDALSQLCVEWLVQYLPGSALVRG